MQLLPRHVNAARNASRLPARTGVVFALSGGGSHGAAQAGMLAALLEAGIYPDALVGCSVGALNAAFLAGDPSPARAGDLVDVWNSITARDVFGRSRRHAAWNLLTRSDHLFDANKLRELIARFCPAEDLADMVVPLHVVTTDLDAGRPAWWSGGPARQILAASACLPALFPPVLLPGSDGTLRRHVDGGVTTPVPVTYAAGLGSATVYVLDVSGEQASPDRLSALGVLLRSFTISRYVNLPEPTTTGLPGQEIVVLPCPDLGGVGIRDFSRSRDLAADAHSRTAQFLADRQMADATLPAVPSMFPARWWQRTGRRAVTVAA